MTEYVVDLTDKQTTDLRKVRHERIVRCRDCKHANPYSDCRDEGEWLDCLHFSEWDYYADVPGHCPVKPDFFCANGETEEDE